MSDDAPKATSLERLIMTSLNEKLHRRRFCNVDRRFIAIYGNVRTVLDSDVITPKCNSLAHKIMFLQKETSLQKELGVESPETQAVYFCGLHFLE